MNKKLLSIVAPAYNEEDSIAEFNNRLIRVLEKMDCRYEIIYINDGSTDDTFSCLKKILTSHNGIRIVDLSRNFGKEIAMSAGLDHASGDAVVVIDTDLQDPPEVIHQLYDEWQCGFDVVYAQRATRDGESYLKKSTAKAFYKIMGKVGGVEIPRDTGDFRLLSRRAVDALGKLREQHRFMKGLFAWIGFRQKAVIYNRDSRFAGRTKWNYWKLWNFAIEGFTSFTIAPLKIFSYVGLCISLLSFLYASFIIYKTLVFGEPVRGYPSLMVVILFLGGVQLVGIGIIGEYLGRMFDETKQRPLYFVNNCLGFENDIQGWEKTDGGE
ncbi:MAG: glycosyltransferase family 2 protein [Thermodesulfobacteriota bacterium]|nr:glycosyltransferase family 2 protein [Thermodesulfobacteriota bacterium]